MEPLTVDDLLELERAMWEVNAGEVDFEEPGWDMQHLCERHAMFAILQHPVMRWSRGVRFADDPATKSYLLANGVAQ